MLACQAKDRRQGNSRKVQIRGGFFVGIFSTSSLWLMLTTLKRWKLMLVKNQFSILPNAAFYKHRSETLQYREDLLNTPSENHFICNVQNEQNNVQFYGYFCRKRSMLASNKLSFEKSAFNQLDHFAFCIQ